MKRRWILPVFLLLFVVFGMANAYKRTRSELGLYVETGELMMAGGDIYLQEPGRPAFAYPPFCGLVTAPIALFPAKLQRGAWFLVMFGLLCVTGVLLARIRRVAAPWTRDWSPRRNAVFLALVAALSVRFVLSVLSNQSHDLIILAMLVAAIHASATEGRELRAGLWAGLAAAFKATPLLFLPVFLWQRRWKASAALVIAMTAATLLPDLLFPRRDGERAVAVWVERFAAKVSPGDAPAQTATWREWNELNQSLTGTITRLTLPPPPTAGPDVTLLPVSRGTRKLLILAAQGLVGLLLVWATWPRKGGAGALRRTGEGAAVACAMLLLSPVSSKSHFSLLVLPVFFVILVLERWRDIGAAVCLAGIFLFGTFVGKGLLPRHLAAWILAVGSVTLTALFAYAGALRSIAILPRQGNGDAAPDPEPITAP